MSTLADWIRSSAIHGVLRTYEPRSDASFAGEWQGVIVPFHDGVFWNGANNCYQFGRYVGEQRGRSWYDPIGNRYPDEIASLLSTAPHVGWVSPHYRPTIASISERIEWAAKRGELRVWKRGPRRLAVIDGSSRASPSPTLELCLHDGELVALGGFGENWATVAGFSLSKRIAKIIGSIREEEA